MSKNDTALRDRFATSSSSGGLVVQALLSALALQGCLVTELDPNYCANVNGDFFCKHRHGSDGPSHCLHVSNACLIEAPEPLRSDPSFDGCLNDRPEDVCYSPCGSRQSFLENSSCVEGTTETTNDTSTSDSGGMTTTGMTSEVGMDETSFASETTSGASTTSGETTEVTITSSSTGDISSSSESTTNTTGETGDACESWGSTNWGGCLNELGALDVELMCGMGASCLIPSPEPVLHTACSVGCVDICDCPDPPATGTSAVACDDIDGDAQDECHLDCSMGSCPDGMDCMTSDIGSMYCVTLTEPAPMYGACDAGCAPPGECFTTTNSSHEVCVVPCFEAASCAPTPGMENAVGTCGFPFYMGVEDVCYLSCSADADCPHGMDCVLGLEVMDGILPTVNICLWPI